MFTPIFIGLVVLQVFGWLPRARQWEAATGWNRIPSTALPPGGISSHLFADNPDLASIHWLGHSGFVIQWGPTRLLLDPNTNGRCSLSRRFLEPAAELADRPVDVVCLS